MCAGKDSSHTRIRMTVDMVPMFDHAKEKMNKFLLIGLLAGDGIFGAVSGATAQAAASSTTVGVAILQTSKIASGWSVKKTVLGATIYNDTGERIGKVKDLIISADRQVSYVIIAAGGFVGIGSHDVAIPVTQLQNLDGRLVMPGATKDTLKAMPHFEYANGTNRRDGFIAKTERDLSKARDTIASLQKKADSTTDEAKSALELKINASQLELKSTESRLDEMKNAAADRWKEFEAGVNSANRRLHQSLA